MGLVDCFLQCKVAGSQIALDGVQRHDMGTTWWSLAVLWWGAVRIIILVSASSSERAMCPNTERRRDWIISVRLGCIVILLTPSVQTKWRRLIPSSVLKHH